LNSAQISLRAGRIIQVEAAAIDPQYHPASTAPQTSLNTTQNYLSAASVVKESAMSTTKTAVRADPAVSEWITAYSECMVRRRFASEK